MAYKEKVCKNCNTVFVPKSGNQVICRSKECKFKSQQAAEARRDKKVREARTKTKFCLVCSEEFTTSDTKRRYCGKQECEDLRRARNSRKSEETRLAKLREVTVRNKKFKLEDKLESIREAFKEHGYSVCSETYVNSNVKLQVVCPEGHTWFVSPKAFIHNGARCFTCYQGDLGQTLSEVEEYISSIGYVLLDGVKNKKYSVADRLKYRCLAGHENEAYYYALKTGNRCRKCFSDSLKNNFEDIKKMFSGNGYIVLADEYINNKENIRVLCPKNHEVEISSSRFSSGDRCSVCAYERRRTPFCEIQKLFKEEKYLLESASYTPGKKLKCVCPKGHKWSVLWSEFYNVGTRCGRCSSRVSRPEKEIAGFLEDLNVDIITNNRSVIAPYELDIHIPSKKIAIEYCGLYWHGEKIGRGKEHIRHKLNLCSKLGIHLITIFEDEYLDRAEVVLSRLKSILHLTDKKIYARKCDIQEITNSDARSFLDKNHIQGSGIASKSFGLFYRTELVQVMTFGRLSRPGTHSLPEVELKRLASKINTNIVGGASKLFKRGQEFARDKGMSAIRSYCDLRWSNYDRTVYDALGFDNIKETKYTPHYFRGQKRYRNNSLSKTPEERLTGKTEWELRQEQGYDRIWDCGQRTYVFKL